MGVHCEVLGPSDFGVVTDLAFALKDAPRQSMNWRTTSATSEGYTEVVRTMSYPGLSQSIPDWSV